MKDRALELGIMLCHVERTLQLVVGIGHVHVCPWGDGNEHLHSWFMARPARMQQRIGSFGAAWDNMPPPTPNDVWKAHLAHIAPSSAGGISRPK